MVRPYLALLNHADIDFGEPFGPQVPRARFEPQAPEAHVSSDWLLRSMLIVAMLGLSVRAAMAMAKAWKNQTVVEGAKDVDVADPPVFLGKVYLDVAVKVAATMSHGLMAVKWILSGEEAGLPLVISMVLVAVNTQMLVTVVQIGHLRNLVLKLGVSKNVRLKFAGVGSLMQIGAGRACVGVNAVAILLLVVHLRQRLYERYELLPWLLTAIGTVAWANRTLQGIGSGAWKDIKAFATIDADVLDVEGFLDDLGANKDLEEDRTCTSCVCIANVVDMSTEDQLLLKNQTLLFNHAFPSLPRLRFVHGVMLVLLNLCCFLVPSALVGLCMTEVPELEGLDVVGATVHPALNKLDSHYYIRLQDGWKEKVSITFELPIGKASRFDFCCRSGCSSLAGSERGSTLLLSSEIQVADFGTCNLHLYGMRFKEYQFTVLVLQGLELASRFGKENGSFKPFNPTLQNYEVFFTSKSLANLSLEAMPEVETNTKADCVARSCKYDSCHRWHLSGQQNGRRNIAITELVEVGGFNLSLWIKVSPASAEEPSLVYQISVIIIDLRARLEEIAVQISELQAQVGTLAEFESANNSVQTDLRNMIQLRDQYLHQAYALEQEDKFEEMSYLTFMAVGLTGTGKSEMCHWMTGNLESCNPSSSMASHTSEVQEVRAYPFADAKMRPKIKWVDTPGRGDTRGKDADIAMWNETMSFLVDRLDVVDRIVWVINSAWQRGTAVRKMILGELRQSFGFHLYAHLDLVFNFLPHVSNKTEYDIEVLRPQRMKFIRWIQEQEMNRFNWSTDLWQGVEEEINRTGFYGLSIHPNYLQELPRGLPVSAPYLDWFQPFSHPAGVRELVRFYKTARDNRHQPHYQGLRLNNRHPQIGPGTLEQVVLLHWKCGLIPDPVKEQVFVPGVAVWHLKLIGKHFSMDDRAVLLPQGTECGHRDIANWSAYTSGIHGPAGPMNYTSQDHEVEYWLHVAREHPDPQLCFCEAPRSNESWRFGQSTSQSISAPPHVREQCSSMVRKIDTRSVASLKREGQWGWGSWARVGDELFAIPWQPNHILGLNLATEEVSNVSEFKTEKMAQFATASAVVGECIYAAPLNSDSILVVNSTSRKVSQLKDSRYLTDERETQYSSIAAIGSILFLIPRSASGSLLLVDVSNAPAPASFRSIRLVHPSGEAHWPSYKYFFSEEWSWMWHSVVAVNNLLYASPRDAVSMLTFDVETESFGAIETSHLDEGPNKWHQMIEGDGKLYASPERAQHILVVDIAGRKANGIHVKQGTWSNKGESEAWTGIARHGMFLYLAPSHSQEILCVNIQTHQMYGMRPGPGLNPLRWAHFTDAIIAKDRLFLLPDQEEEVLVWDLKPPALIAPHERHEHG